MPTVIDRTPSRRRPVLTALALAVLLAACGNEAANSGRPPPREHLVEVAEARRGGLDYPAERAGSLRALREVRLRNEEPGRVREVRVREGDRVREGEVLLRYDDGLLAAAVDKAAAAAAIAAAEHRRAVELVGRGFVSAESEARARANLEIAEAELRQLRTRQGYLTLRAPFTGIVAERRVEPADVTPLHTHLLTLVDLDSLITDVAVSELVLPRLRIGDAAAVRIDALGEATHPGRISRIHPGVDPATGTGRVEVRLDPLPAGARPGQFCRVTIAAGDRDSVTVPQSAVLRDAAAEFVYLYQPPADGKPGRALRREVATGLRLADRVEISAGLAGGETVIVRGFLGLADGKPVRAVGAPAAAEGRAGAARPAGTGVPAPPPAAPAAAPR